jgi:hypothetical protein
VDASHLYPHVEADIRTSRMVLHDQGMVVCDDFRQPHTPGVAAAVWAAVVCGELRPICLSDSKFYGTWGDPGPIQDDLLGWLATFGPDAFETQVIAGNRVVRVGNWRPPKTQIRSAAQVAVDRPPSGSVIARRKAAVVAKRVAREVLPPVLTRALSALRTVRK